MGWIGIVILGAVIGLAGWWFHPLRGGQRRGIWQALVAGVAGATLANAAGRLSGAFLDGEMLQWPVSAAVALLAVAVMAPLAFRR